MKGSLGVALKLASAKIASVPMVVKTTKIQRKRRSTTMATYCQSSFSYRREGTRIEGKKEGRKRRKEMYKGMENCRGRIILTELTGVYVGNWKRSTEK